MPYQQSLTPEQMQQLLSSQGWGYGGQQSLDGSGIGYARTGIENIGDGQNSYSNLGFTGTAPGQVKAGGEYMGYGNGGGQSGVTQYLDGGKTNASDFKDFGQMVMTLAPMMLGGALAGGAFGGAGAAAGEGLGAGSGAFLGEGAMSGIPAWDAAAGSGFAGAGAGSGAFLGEGTTSGIPAWDGAPGGGSSFIDGGGGPMGDGGGDYIPGGNGLGTGSGAFLGEGTTSGIPAWDGAVGSGASLLSSLGKYLGPAASLVGGLLGSKGTQQSQTRDIPEWMKPYVTGAGGLLPGAQSLFAKQTAPGAMPGYQQMQTVGQGLLSQPIAGNGVAQFQAMPRFGAR